MELRGQTNKSPLSEYDLYYLSAKIDNSTVDRVASLAELLSHCGHYFNSATNMDLLP